MQNKWVVVVYLQTVSFVFQPPYPLPVTVITT